MNVVGKVGSLISQGVYSVATPFHPFGGAVDVIIVEQQDGTYRSTPWYVRFGKFQGVLKGAEKVVRISVNGVDAGFHMYLDNSGEAYFVREVVSSKDTESDQHLKNSDISESTQDDNGSNLQSENGVSNAGDIEFSNACVENGEIENEEELLEFRKEQASQASPVGSLGYGAYHYGSLDQVEDLVKSQGSESEVVLVSVDGHVLTAPISSSEENTDYVQLSTPRFHLGPAEGTEVTIEQLQDSAEFSGNNGDLRTSEDAWVAGLFGDLDESKRNGVFEGIPPVSDGADTSDYSSDGCKAARKLSYQAQEAPNTENVGDNLGMHGSSEDIDASMSRNEIFRSCMELSELTLSIDDENSPGTGFPLMGLAVNSGMYDSQENSPSTLLSKEETQAGDHQKLENRATVPFPISNPLCNDESPTVPIQIEASENNAVVNENTDDVVSVPTITNVSQKYEQLGAAPEPQNSESEGMIVPEEECTKLKTGESLSAISGGGKKSDAGLGFEISLCRNFLHAGIGLGSAEEAFNAHQISAEEFKVSGGSIIKNENLIVRFKGRYLTWDKAAPIILGMAAFGLDFPAELKEAIPVEQVEMPKSRENSPVLSSAPSGRSWRLWPIPFRRVKTLQHSNSTSSSDEIFVDSVPYLSPLAEPTQTRNSDSQTSHKQFVRTNIPTSEQIASLNLKDGQNMVAFSFSTRVLGNQQVDAHIYLWKWNTRIVISDVDGTITRSDVLGQFMPLVGKDWTQSGVARLFSAIKENGYQLLFLSARAIVQAYLTRSFLLNLKQI
ncbi:phosphatidate phosphatase PAH1 isoform X2 [Magnolia sinica]|uniref:phosphatidate phosphatase PAH1 isoform X2 n=1 Tax=Magnolia sinica TaxID=86752 RepID=UPI0026593ADC|nr:phosphatidate phosphatase PAH1 isoform X2 [Magnolia sinica]